MDKRKNKQEFSKCIECTGAIRVADNERWRKYCHTCMGRGKSVRDEQDRERERARLKSAENLHTLHIVSKMEGWEESEEFREALCIDKETVFKITLSTGGPADGYKLYYSEQGELMRGMYWCSDWGTYAESELDDDEVALVEQMYYVGGEM